MVQTAKVAPERTKLERTIILVAKSENATVVDFEAENLNTPMPNPTTAIVSQDVPTTLVTAQTLLLLTSTPKFDRKATLTISEPQPSLASYSQHTEKLLSEVPSFAGIFPNAANV